MPPPRLALPPVHVPNLHLKPVKRGRGGFHTPNDISAAATPGVATGSARVRAADTGGQTFHFSFVEISKSLTQEAALHQAYLERQSARGIKEQGNVRAQFGTIGDTYEQRNDFWRRVDAIERSPSRDGLIIDASQSAEWIAAARALPPDQTPPWLTTTLPRLIGANAPVEIEMPRKEARAALKWSRALAPNSPVSKIPSRAGTVQTRLTVELPHELSLEHQREALEKFARATFGAKNFPYWIVMHAPDAHSDARNQHAHIVYYDRPSQHLGLGRWDFEIKRGTPEAKKLGRNQQAKDRSARYTPWIKSMRETFATITNEIMKRESVDKVYDPRPYADMPGVEKIPETHMGPKKTAIERQGAATIEGVQNAAVKHAELLGGAQAMNEARVAKIDALWNQIPALGPDLRNRQTPEISIRGAKLRKLAHEYRDIDHQLADIENRRRLHQIETRAAISRLRQKTTWAKRELQEYAKSLNPDPVTLAKRAEIHAKAAAVYRRKKAELEPAWRELEVEHHDSRQLIPRRRQLEAEFKEVLSCYLEDIAHARANPERWEPWGSGPARQAGRHADEAEREM